LSSAAFDRYPRAAWTVLSRVRAQPWWREPWTPLAILAVLQWALVALLAMRAEHNGWLYYQGGDETFLYSSSVVIGHGHLPEASVGYVWPIAMAPLTWIAGANFIAALPGMVLVQVLVLLPLGLLAVYGCGARVGGRLIGYLSAAVWVLAPQLTTHLFIPSYHEKWFDLTLPQALGLTGMGDFPSMIALVCAAYFVLRLLDEGSDVDAALAAVVTGLAIGLKPSNAIFLGGVGLGLLVARRWRGSLVYAICLAPALLTLALWKYRGLGHLPLLSSSPALREAAGATLTALPVAGAGNYVHLDWHRYGQTIGDLREVFWSRRLLEFLPFAGFLAAARASWARAAFLAGWFGAFFLVKTPRGSIDASDWWRLMTPAWPAFLLLMCALPLLLPGVGPKIRSSFPPEAGPLRARTRPLLAVLGALVLVPLLVVAVLPVQRAETAARLENIDLMDALDPGIHVKARTSGGKVFLSWSGGKPGTARVFYHVLRSPTFQANPPSYTGLFGPTSDGLWCAKSGAPHCALWMDDLGPTRATRWIDTLRPGRWSYRVEVAANFKDDPAAGDPFTYSNPVRVTGR
jgi:hypothetical protein